MSARANFPAGGDEGAIREVAARWVVRKDRKLSAAEAAELAAWLAADARHAAAFERSSGAWRTFRELGSAVRRAPEPAAVVRSGGHGWIAGGLAAAALVVLTWVASDRREAAPAVAQTRSATSGARLPVTRRLTDGSVARLKDGAEIAEVFSAAERRVRLVRGEVFFTVVKEAGRPFFVEVDGVTVRAVGTAFAVRSESHGVDVLVTEGTVQVTPPVATAAASAPAMVGAGQRAVVARAREPEAPAVVVSAVSSSEIARSLAWNDAMLELAGATLGELVGAFEKRTGQRIEFGDVALREVRMGGQFPTNDVDGFLRALAEIYGVKAERRADGVILLRKAR